MKGATDWLRNLSKVAPGIIFEPLLPGAALFSLLLLLSRRFLLEGFVGVRQYALAAEDGKSVLAAAVRRNWWSCSCASLEACRCLAAVIRGVRRCCAVFRGLPRFLDVSPDRAAYGARALAVQ